MDLYREIILEHSKRPHRAGLREPFNAEVHHVNPTCGDEVTLRVQLQGEGRSAIIDDLSYDAAGCSISTASTSVLAEEVTGGSVGEALTTFAAMRRMLTSKGTDPGDEDEIGDGVAFAGVSRYPARVKCALLGWTAFTDALARSGVDISAIPTKGTPTDNTETSTTNARSTITPSTAEARSTDTSGTSSTSSTITSDTITSNTMASDTLEIS